MVALFSLYRLSLDRLSSYSNKLPSSLWWVRTSSPVFQPFFSLPAPHHHSIRDMCSCLSYQIHPFGDTCHPHRVVTRCPCIHSLIFLTSPTRSLPLDRGPLTSIRLSPRCSGDTPSLWAGALLTLSWWPAIAATLQPSVSLSELLSQL